MPGDCSVSKCFPVSLCVWGEYCHWKQKESSGSHDFIYTQKYYNKIFSVGKWAAPFHSGGKVVT